MVRCFTKNLEKTEIEKSQFFSDSVNRSEIIYPRRKNIKSL